MTEISDYEVMMKMLEIIELKQRNTSQPPVEAENEEIRNVIEKIEGNAYFALGSQQEVAINTGDKFANISNSVIATRASIASGIVRVKEAQGDEPLADVGILVTLQFIPG